MLIIVFQTNYFPVNLLKILNMLKFNIPYYKCKLNISNWLITWLIAKTDTEKCPGWLMVSICLSINYLFPIYHIHKHGKWNSAHLAIYIWRLSNVTLWISYFKDDSGYFLHEFWYLFFIENLSSKRWSSLGFLNFSFSWWVGNHLEGHLLIYFIFRRFKL